VYIQTNYVLYLLRTIQILESYMRIKGKQIDKERCTSPIKMTQESCDDCTVLLKILSMVALWAAL